MYFRFLHQIGLKMEMRFDIHVYMFFTPISDDIVLTWQLNFFSAFCSDFATKLSSRKSFNLHEI